MKEKEIDKLCVKIITETNQVKAGIERLEISKNSLKRDKYCKKYKINYTRFMLLVEEAKINIMNLPFYLNVAEFIIQHKHVDKKYKNLLNELTKRFRQIMDQEKVNTKGADEMESFLKGLKNEKDT